MKKIVTMLFLISLLGNSLLSALYLNDLDIANQELVKDYLVENFDEITPINLEVLEGLEYELLQVNDDYVIVVIDDEIYILLKD